MVTITLHGALNLYAPGGERSVRVELHGPTTAGQLLELMGIPLEILSMLLINDRRVDPEALVSDGDLVEAFPFCAGGRGFLGLKSEGWGGR